MYPARVASAMTSRPAMPESDTPDSLLGIASRELRRIRDDNLWVDEPDFHTMTGAIEDFERRLVQAQAKLEEADTALRIRSTECLMQSQRAAQAQTRIAELEKLLREIAGSGIAEHWRKSIGRSIDSALKSRP